MRVVFLYQDTMPPFFCHYSGSTPKAHEKIFLPKEESHHLIKVLRARLNDSVTLFDGQGHIYHGAINAIESNCRTEILVQACETVIPQISITLLQAIPKGKTMDSLIRKVTEIGLTDIVPILTERTECNFTNQRCEDKRERWQSIAIEACKQSRNPILPRIHNPRKYSELIEHLDDTLPSKTGHHLRLIASLQDNAQPLIETFPQPNDIEAITLLIGPEGDFSPQEYTLAASKKFKPISLSKTILRVETAAVYALSVINQKIR